jgi:uncharacterized Rossmann fold enzyme
MAEDEVIEAPNAEGVPFDVNLLAPAVPINAPGGFSGNRGAPTLAESLPKPKLVEPSNNNRVKRYYIHRKSLVVYPVGDADPYANGIPVERRYVNADGQVTKKIERIKDYIPISKEEVEVLEYNRRRLLKKYIEMRGIHQGRVFHILGNGPSLPKTIGKIIDTDMVISCNAAYLVFPNANYWTCLDLLVSETRPLHRELQYYFMEESKTTKKIISVNSWFNYMTASPYAIFKKDDDMQWDGSVCHAACCMAMFFGASKIIIHGVDYQDRGHFYKSNDTLDKPDQRWDNITTIMNGWAKIADMASKRGIPIFNANHNSMVHNFQKWELGCAPDITPQDNKIPLSSGEKVLPQLIPQRKEEILAATDAYLAELQNKRATPATFTPPKPLEPKIELKNSVTYNLQDKTLEICADNKMTVIPFEQIEDKYLLQVVKRLQKLVETNK